MAGRIILLLNAILTSQKFREGGNARLKIYCDWPKREILGHISYSSAIWISEQC